MFQMSPFRPPRSFLAHCGLRIVRPKEKLVKGVKVRACDFITLYENLCGRVQALKNIDENILEIIQIQGKDKSSLRKVILAPNYPLTKIASSDLLVIPWGIRPNIWTPPFADSGLGPQIWLQTPTGEVKLVWDGNKYTSATLDLAIINDEWCLSGEIDFCFTSCNLLCNAEFPAGYSFIKSTGPNAYFEITQINPQQDLEGRFSHVSLLVEAIDQKNVILSE